MISITPHPSAFLENAWIDLIRKEADKSMIKGQLTSMQLKLFYQQGWFKALVPEVYGGLQWPLSKVVRFEEAIGWTEGSAGWVFTLCSGAGWFGGYLDPAFAKKIFRSKRACLAGSGAIGGTGTVNKKGDLMISGQWQYATGAPHASIFTANVYLEKEQAVRSFLFFPEEVSIAKTWQPIGLIGSASESFSVRRVIVPSERCFDINPDKAVIADVLYRLPFGPLAEATIAANLSGMALHFMEAVEQLWFNKKGKMNRSRQVTMEPAWLPGAARLLDGYCQKWLDSRSGLWAAIDSLESFVENNIARIDLKSDRSYERISAAVSGAARIQAALCREIVNGLYPYTGLTGASTVSAVGKIWRDFQTGSQHALFVPEPVVPGAKKGK